MWNKRICANNWCAEIKQLFGIIEKEVDFINNNQVDLALAYSRLHKYFCDKWKQKVIELPELRTYTLIKEVHEPEPYITSLLPKFQRILMAQLRSGVFPIMLEIGRYLNLPVSSRVCKICNDGNVEDEIHFVCICQAYSDARRDLFNYMIDKVVHFTELSDKEKYILMMKYHQRQVAKYIERAYLTWRNIMYH